MFNSPLLDELDQIMPLEPGESYVLIGLYRENKKNLL